MAIITVGPAGEFSDLPSAVSKSVSGDEIHIMGSLEILAPVVTTHALRFVGLGIRPVLTARGLFPKGEGVLTTHGDTSVQNLEFRQARALTGNGAGIWHTGGRLQVIDSVFVHNQNGLMLASGKRDTARIVGCSFLANGAGCGHTHGIYASAGGTLDVERCSFEDTSVGHHLKSRVAGLRVITSYFGGLPTATTSYAVDVANGGIAEIARNLFVKGRAAMSGRFIAYCSEDRRHGSNQLDVQSNIFISHRRTLSTAVTNFAPFTPASLRGNAYEGRVLALLGRGRDHRRRHAGTAILRGAPSLLDALATQETDQRALIGPDGMSVHGWSGRS